MAQEEKQSRFAKMREINFNVPDELVEKAIVWLDSKGSVADVFHEALERGAFYKITKSPNAPNGIQVWCNEDDGCVSGPGHTPNHELWLQPDGNFEIVDDLPYG